MDLIKAKYFILKDYEHMNKAEKQLYRVSTKLCDRGHLINDGYINKRVPVVYIDGYFSLVYFTRTKSFTLFTKELDSEGNKIKIKLKEIKDVLHYIEENSAGM